MERYYTFDLISYRDEIELIQLLSNKKLINHWAMIMHDLDVKESGELKVPHHHIIVTFKQNKSLQWVRRYFEEGTDQTTLAQECIDKEASYLYLTHENAPDKVQYNKEDIIHDDITYWKDVEEQNEDKNKEFVDDLIEERLSEREMGYKYGRDYIKNYQKYKEWASVVRFAEYGTPTKKK